MNAATWLSGTVSRIGQAVVWFAFRLLHLRKGTTSSGSGCGIAPSPVSSENLGSAQRRIDEGGRINWVMRAESGGIFAAYSFRFVAIPLTYLNDCLQDTLGTSLDELSSRLPEDRDYCRRVIETCYDKAGESSSVGGEYLKEEMFHHKHLYGTSLWVFTNASAVLMRFAMCYMAFHRLRARDVLALSVSTAYCEVVRFLFNVYFQATYLKSLGIPAIEGYAHFREIGERREALSDLEDVYGARTAAAASSFVDLWQRLVSVNGEQQARLLIEQIARHTVDLPLASSGVLDGVSFAHVKKCKQDYADALKLDPYIRLTRIQSILKTDSPLTLRECYQQIEDSIPTSTFENRLGPGLLWYFTRTAVPDQLVWFIVYRILLSRFGIRVLARLLGDVLVRGGERLNQYAYAQLPGMRLHTYDGRAVYFDPARQFFGKKPVLASEAIDEDKLSFEPELRGSSPEMFDLVRLQMVLMNSVAAKFFNYPEHQIDSYRKFIFRWMPELARHQDELEAWLHWLDCQCENLVASLLARLDKKLDPLAGKEFTHFVFAFEKLLRESQLSLSEGSNVDIRESVLKFGDGLYMHGLA